MLTAAFWWRPVGAETDPIPEPTDAAEQVAQTVAVESQVRVIDGDLRSAREAALLSGYRKLIEIGQQRWGFGVVLEPEPGESKRFVIDERHPNERLLAWALRAEVKNQRSHDSQLWMALESPSVGELSALSPSLVGSQTIDVDGDGVQEKVGLGFDGRVYLQKYLDRDWETVASSPSLARFESLTRRDGESLFEQVRVTRPEALEKVRARYDRATVTVRLLSSEQVNGRLVGRQRSPVTVDILLDQGMPGPGLSIEEPFDFSDSTQKELNLFGAIEAPAKVTAADLRLNGRKLWQSPAGYSAPKVKLDLVLKLSPGWNRLTATVLDSREEKLVRELLLRNQAIPQSVDPSKRWALVVDTGRDEHRELVEVLTRFGGFPAQQITVLSGRESTSQAINAALERFSHQSEGFLLFYYQGRIWSGNRPLALRLEDKAVEFEGWFEAPEGMQILGLFDIEENRRQPLDWSTFSQLSRLLEEQGWAVVAGQEGRLEEELGRAFTADLNQDRVVELEEFYRRLVERFQAEQRRPPILRGLLTGGLALAVAPEGGWPRPSRRRR